MRNLVLLRQGWLCKAHCVLRRARLMDWIKMRSNLDTDPDVLRIAAELGIDELSAIGRLWKLWSWADQHSIDGNAMSVTEALLDRISRTEGMARAMRNVGWLSGEDGNLSFPRFNRHNGQTAKQRGLTAKRVQAHRNGDVTLVALPDKRRGDKSTVPPISPKGGAPEARANLEWCLRIYMAYPRRRAKPAAIRAIGVAIRKIGYDRLLGLTVAYARAVAGEPIAYIPYPQKWFNQEQYLDDPSTWVPERAPSKPKSASQLRLDADFEKYGRKH